MEWDSSFLGAVCTVRAPEERRNEHRISSASVLCNGGFGL